MAETPRRAARALARVARCVLTGFSWALVPVAVMLAAGAAYRAGSGESGLLDLAWLLALHVAGGAAGSYLLHEGGHVLVLSACPGVRDIGIHSGLLRFSVVPRGEITRTESILTALAGPGVCGLAGLALLAGGSPLAWWYLAHLAFLLPVFGDGRSIVRAIRGARDQAEVSPDVPNR
ncbi:hypothetical protein [Actinoplanes philippinensis]|uniref:hypothetical protein n=1 Tax=Actinoplanes philippinensis TaxID=35752 RepID=UPI0033CDBA75